MANYMSMKPTNNNQAIEHGNMELLSFNGINPEFYIHRTIVQVQNAYSNMTENPESGFIIFILKVRQFEAEMRARDFIPQPNGKFRNRIIKEKKPEVIQEVEDPDSYEEELEEGEILHTAKNYYLLLKAEKERLDKNEEELDSNMRKVMLAYYKYELLCEILFDDNKPVKKLYMRG